MVYVSGTFTFQEARGKDAHIFALCDLGTDVFEPVSAPSHQNVHGVESTLKGRQIRIRSAVLPEGFRRAFIGIYLPTAHSLTDEDYRLQLAYQDGATRTLHPKIENAHPGDRFAVVAILTPSNGEWNAGRLNPPRVFKEKYDLGSGFSVPKWWRFLAG